MPAYTKCGHPFSPLPPCDRVPGPLPKALDQDIDAFCRACILLHRDQLLAHIRSIYEPLIVRAGEQGSLFQRQTYRLNPGADGEEVSLLGDFSTAGLARTFERLAEDLREALDAEELEVMENWRVVCMGRRRLRRQKAANAISVKEQVNS